ncbi:16S rRNA (guanine(966)-N(2))-methyltransferase RsmD [Marinobacter sp. V034]|uniref:16S rRNA (guanine(966)-N(2))-methyltransferase RsmD n=1 Tax=Marinobacter sp. V034 TaxID=3459610 RepID=UPI0040449576
MPRKSPSRPSKISSRRPTAGQADSGELRIIGGQWRSRTLTFPAVGGVRPTPSRVRETLFNWLMPVVPGARCIDLFAGSGVLGLEALSRGAEQVEFVDHTRPLTDALSANLKTLRCTDASVKCQDILAYLGQKPAQAADIVMMDPPFRQNWLSRLLPLIRDNGWVSSDSWVYIEHESELQSVPAPENWQLHREKTAGQVCYRLYRVMATDA